MSKDSVIIRPMTDGDLEDVIAIEDKTFSDPFSLELFSNLVHQEAFHCFVAELGGEIVGYVIYSIVIDESEIINIAVCEDHRKHGIGSMLLKKMLGDVRSVGGVVVFLEVRPSNDVARAFYEKFGFYQISVRPEYYEDNGEDALVYTKEITR